MPASASASAFASHQLNHLGDFYSRRLLLHNPLYPPPISPSSSISHDTSSSSPPDQYPGDNSFDANVVMVLSVLLCALICSLGLNSIIKCALKCSSFVNSDSSSSSDNSARLANTGVKKKALKTFPTVIYSPDLNLPGLDTECMICLSEFTTGERVKLLPKCSHGFHVSCIDKWLSSHSSCPKCRQSLIETCKKIVGFTPTASSSSETTTRALPVQETVVSIVALQPEGFIRNYRGITS